MSPAAVKHKPNPKAVGRNAAAIGADVYVFVGRQGSSKKDRWIVTTQTGALAWRLEVAPVLPGDDLDDGRSHAETALGVSLLDWEARGDTHGVGRASLPLD